MEINIKLLNREEFKSKTSPSDFKSGIRSQKSSSPRSFEELRCSKNHTFDHISPSSSPETSPRNEADKSPPLSPVSIYLLNYHQNKHHLN